MKYLLIVLMFFLTACDEESCHDVDSAFAYRYKTSKNLVLKKQPGYYGSCQEIIDETSRKMNQYNDLIATHYDNAGLFSQSSQCTQLSSVSQTEGNADQSVNQPTNVQEKAIDEADLVKISKDYIFYAKRGRIEVVRKDNLERIRSLEFYKHETPKIYVFNEVLIAIHGHFDQETLSRSSQFYTPQPKQIKVSAFDIGKELRTLHSEIVDGNYQTSRMNSKGELTVVTTTQLGYYHQSQSEQAQRVASLLQNMDCSKIQRPFVNDHDFSLTNLHRFKLFKGQLKHHKTHLSGQFKDVYMKDQLFLSKSISTWSEKNEIVTTEKDQQLLLQLSSEAEGWQTQASGIFSGRTLGSWSYKQVGGTILVASAERSNTPTAQTWLDANADSTSFHVIKKMGDQLSVVNSITGIAPRENLKSARFEKDYAYIVTLRERTDPLFVIDIKNPETPILQGELKIPGFSSYMHPAGFDRVIGVGFPAEAWSGGLQLSLFDVAKPLSPQVLEQIQLQNNSSSLAQYDHHAFYYDLSRQRLALPIRSVRYFNQEWMNQSGAYFYDLSNNKLQLKNRISHKSWLNSFCPIALNYRYTHSTFEDITRILNIDGRLMTFSNFGVMEHNQEDPMQITRRGVFSDPESSCPQPYAFCNIIY